MRQAIGSSDAAQPMGHAPSYLFLSLLSGILETGAFTFGVAGFGLPMGLALALSYQMGCLARNPLGLSLKGAAVLLCVALPLSCLSGGNPFLMLPAVMLLSGAVQSARDGLMPKTPPIPVSTKRVFRVAGFVTGILCGSLIGHALPLCVSVAACLVVLPAALARGRKTPWTRLNRRFASGGYGWIMLVHQTHYFAYAYVLLALLLGAAGMTATDITPLRAVTASLWFALGWCTYISGEWILKNVLRMPSRKAAISGHLVVAVCLVCMALLIDRPFLLGLAWVLGGFGGGSVYAIKDLARENACPADIELWEHWGHMFGVSISLAGALLFPHTLAVPFLLALAAALGTLALLCGNRNRCMPDIAQPVSRVVGQEGMETSGTRNLDRESLIRA